MSGKDKKGQRSGAGNSLGRNFGKWSHKNRQKRRFDNGEKDDSLVASRGNRPGAKPILHPDSAFSKRLSKISASTFTNIARIIGEVDEKILKEMAVSFVKKLRLPKIFASSGASISITDCLLSFSVRTA